MDGHAGENPAHVLLDSRRNSNKSLPFLFNPIYLLMKRSQHMFEITCETVI